MQETEEGDRGGGATPPRTPEPPRVVNLAAVAGFVVLIGLVAFALYRKSHPLAPVREPAPAGAAEKQETGTGPMAGTPISATLPVRLTPEATIIAERYRCVCSCNDPLNVCTCTKTPGSHDMRTYVQELVNQKKSGKEIDAAMIARYRPNVVMSGAAPTPTPSATPSRKKR